MLIATEVQLHLGYTPSKWNTVDPPSRGVTAATRHSAERGPRVKDTRKTLVEEMHALKSFRRRVIKNGTMPHLQL